MASSSTLRRTAVAVGVAVAILVPAVTSGLHLGLSQAEFAAQGDSTLRAVPMAFAIWGVIYLGLIAYAIFQLRAAETAALARFGWPSAISSLSCAAWIVASALDQQLACVLTILVGVGAALSPLLQGPVEATPRERWFVVRPNALLAGWLTAAAALNILSALTTAAWIPPSSADAWAYGAVAVVTIVALGIAARAHSAVYLLPAAWALVGIHLAAREDVRPTLAMLAIAGASVLTLGAGALALRGRARR
jgi:hypothetical protein